MRSFLAFLVYVVVEFAVAVAVAALIGWFAVIILVIAGLAFGLVIMSNAGTQAASALRSAQQSGDLPEGTVGDSALLFAAGLLIAIPGFLTDLIGLLLMIPPLRRLVRRWAAGVITRRLQARGLSVLTTNVDGTTVTRVVPGDVVAGEVISRADEDPTKPPPVSG